MKHLRFAALVAVAVPALAISSTAYATFPGHNGLIAFAADPGSGYQIYTLRPNGHDLAQITTLSGDARHPTGRRMDAGSFSSSTTRADPRFARWI
jgi:hypothetical protein